MKGAVHFGQPLSSLSHNNALHFIDLRIYSMFSEVYSTFLRSYSTFSEIYSTFFQSYSTLHLKTLVNLKKSPYPLSW